jgi:hypothetical protein
MSRISAYGAAVTSTTVTAVVALCLVGGFAGHPPVGTVATTLTADATTSATASGKVVSAIDAGLASGAHGGAFFGTGAGLTKSLDSSTNADVGAGDDTASAVLSLPVLQTLSSVVTSTPAALAVGPAIGASVAAAPVPQLKAVLPAAVIPTTPRQDAQALAAARGWGQQQWVCLDELWQRESNFRPTVANRRSGAYGIPQALPASKMASAGKDWRSNPVTQIQWGLGYISARYGNPCNAWSHWRRYRSY